MQQKYLQSYKQPLNMTCVHTVNAATS